MAHRHTINYMAWEWVPPVVGGVVSVVSVTSALWSATAIRRGQQKADAYELVRGRTEDLYISILADARAQLASSRPKVTIIGEPKTPLSTDEMLLRSARLAVFANPEIVATNDEFTKVCNDASYWKQVAWARFREVHRDTFPNDPHYQLPEEAEKMSPEQLDARAQGHWDRANGLYDKLADQIRHELRPPTI